MIRDFVSKIFKSNDPVMIEPYGGFANDTHIFSQARVLEDEGIEHHEEDGVLKNLWNTFKRLESDEIPDAVVDIEWGANSERLTADNEGYIYIKVPHKQHVENEQSKYLPLSMRLVHPDHKFVTSTEILKPGSDVDFGVISDMDDTVIDTGVASKFKWRLLVNSLAVHAQKRRPLEGVQEFYQALHQGKELMSSNPFFYVSNSPWNLHEYLTTFLQHNNFPRGPLILRDIGISMDRSDRMEDGAKYRTIVKILEAYPKMQFVLIGDSAEIDTDIYMSISRRFPDQIKAIFIRTVSDAKRVQRVKDLIESEEDIDVRLIEDGAEGLKHARELGLV